jgi:serine/threonine-protein kinase
MFASHAEAAAVAAVILLASLLYVVLVLPRVPSRAGLVATLVLALVLALSAWLAAVPTGLALLAGCIALVFGQCGWSLQRQPSTAAGAPARGVAPVAPRPSTQTAVAAPGGGGAIEHHTLGRYLVDRQLGRGAMGAVYLGHDPKIGRQVAIKTMALSQEFDGAELTEARARFFREAETAGRLQHRDIVTIFDAGEDHELAYIAMEYLKGHDLQRYTTVSGLMPVPQVLRIVARVAEALAYAHSQGVVHRDIKPANVMIDPVDDSVKVTDFGIARITDASRTRTGMVMGTPSFMSPEQMSGRRVDGRSDLYSLGVMLFQLLTGRLPHAAESMAKLMYEIANEPSPDIRSLRRDLPEALANVVALALEKRPEVRYADGRQFAKDLRTVEAAWTPVPSACDAALVPAVPPNSDGFAATVKLPRSDPGHNSPL